MYVCMYTNSSIQLKIAISNLSFIKLVDIEIKEQEKELLKSKFELE